MQTNIDITKGISFDSSLSNIDDVVSESEYRQHLISLLKPILEQRFPGNFGKQQIRPYVDRISFACPICGDSMKSNYKKRGNFILRGKYAHFFKCHNCGEAKRIDQFFTDYKINLDLSVINYIAKGIEDFSSHSNIKYDMSLFLDMDAIDKYAIDKNYLCKQLNLSNIDNTNIQRWLNNRLQFNKEKFLYNMQENNLFILNLTQSGKILGMQKRLFYGNTKYLTYKLSKIYEMLNMNSSLIPEEIDTISSIFNICLLDYSKSIILLEGPFDSFLIPNSIANTGANKTFPLDIQLKYLYDKDDTGINRSIEHINDGDEVFLWEKFLRDINAPYRKKWDINDILIWSKQNNIKLPNFENYFSNDPLDMLDI